MILYFDTYIIDRSLSRKNPYAEKDNIRAKSPAYRMPRKVDIAKYTLASYAIYPWSDVLIKYELAEGGYEEFDKFIYSLFPKAIVIHQRSDSQADYIESIKILDTFKNDWIFYSPNNDHPLMISKSQDIAFIGRLIEKAEEYARKEKFVSVAYSHWSEYINATDKRYPYFDPRSELLEENDDCRVFKIPIGDYSSIQVVNKNLFRDWFTFSDLNDRRVMRAEDLAGARNQPQIEIVPKKELCAHFDGYEHMLGYRREIFTDLIPPLLIPQGFFENQIKIAYGYNEYRPGWTNINPLAKHFSFRDLKNGADLKWNREDIPLFWKNRISELDVNKNLDPGKELKAKKRNLEILLNPWSLKSQGYNFKSFRFHLKRLVYPIRPWLENFGLIPILKRLFRY